MAHDVARTIVDVAAAKDAQDLATMLQRRSFTLELFNEKETRFVELNFGFDGHGMVHASLRPCSQSAFDSMVIPESSLDALVRCACKVTYSYYHYAVHPMETIEEINNSLVGTGVMKGRLVLCRVAQKGRPLLQLGLGGISADEVHREIMTLVELAKAMQPAEQVV
jgi:hypothetical protein